MEKRENKHNHQTPNEPNLLFNQAYLVTYMYILYMLAESKPWELTKCSRRHYWGCHASICLHNDATPCTYLHCVVDSCLKTGLLKKILACFPPKGKNRLLVCCIFPCRFSCISVSWMQVSLETKLMEERSNVPMVYSEMILQSKCTVLLCKTNVMQSHISQQASKLHLCICMP